MQIYSNIVTSNVIKKHNIIAFYILQRKRNMYLFIIKKKNRIFILNKVYCNKKLICICILYFFICAIFLYAAGARLDIRFFIFYAYKSVACVINQFITLDLKFSPSLKYCK